MVALSCITKNNQLGNSIEAASTKRLKGMPRLKDLEEITKYKLANGPYGGPPQDESRRKNAPVTKRRMITPARGRRRSLSSMEDEGRVPISKSLEDLEKSIHGSTEDQFVELVKAIVHEEITKYAPRITKRMVTPASGRRRSLPPEE